jgi:DNA polymerase-3 subunit epsilon
LILELAFVTVSNMRAVSDVGALGGQRSFDDMGTPLHAVTFCVVDLETTGGSPADCAITEVGAVKLRGGECLGTLQTLVDPGQSIPRSITVLTGITEAMVARAPPIESVLPTLLEFIGGSVIVGHNVRFDIGFLDAALLRAGRSRLANARVDTCALARRLVREEVPDCRLSTLADRFRLGHRPTHRALDDALATGHLLHTLLERAAAYGVLGLDDLLTLATMGGHPQAPKLRLTTGLPRAPGVYVFRDGAGTPLYVGKATNLRARVRSYFSSDDRRKIGPLLRETQSIDHVVCDHPLAAAVEELRLIQRMLPRYNRAGTGARRAAYVRLTLDEPFPRLSVVASPRGRGTIDIGPLGSRRAAAQVVEAIQTAAPLRRCTLAARPGRALRSEPCAPAQLGVALCPCTGEVGVDEYAPAVERVRRGITTEPALLLEPLRDRMDALARAERFEEAADTRDRGAALAAALERQRRVATLWSSGRMVLDVAGAGDQPRRIELRNGRLPADGDDRDDGGDRDDGRTGAAAAAPEPLPFPAAPGATATGELPALAPELAAELACVSSWLDANAHRTRLLHCDGVLASPVRPLPTFRSVERRR